MSSRSFRRRNNRRKHGRPGAASDAHQPSQRGPGGHPPGGRRSPGERPRGAETLPARNEPPLVFPDCPICKQPVKDLASALTHRETRQPAHFDCIMRELRDSNELAPQEKICYLGGGAFGILEFRQGPSRFVIRKRIQYEEKEAAQEWKKPLLISL
ncbi:MAG: hypothetical protein ACLQCB_15100 [Spirochaetia bacterium]